MYIVIRKLKKLLGMTSWAPHWRGDLEQALSETIKSSRVHMAVVVAKESDSYSELLFLLTLLGISTGSMLAYFARDLLIAPLDILSLPLLGFASGVLVYQFRGLYVRKLAPKAVKERVANKAKAFYYDYLTTTSTPLYLLYFSEIEKEAYFVSMPHMLRELGALEKDLQSGLNRLIVNYNENDPIPSIKAALNEIASVLVQKNDTKNEMSATEDTKSLVFMPSDSVSEFPSVMLKGTKDIN